MTTRPWRQEIELIQNYPKHKTFTHTNTTNVQETALNVSANMEECNKVSFIVELADAYIEFDGNASTTSMLIPANEGYFDDSIYIGSKISIINATADSHARIRGIIWGR